MRNHLYYLWLLFWLCGNATHPAYADTAKKDSLPATIVHDSSALTIREFDKAAIDRFRANPDFQYDKQQLDLSWWQRFKRWVKYKIFELMTKEGSWSLLKNTIIVLGIVALLYLIMKLLGMDMASLFSRNAKSTGLAYTEHIEDIHGIDFDAELSKAIETRNYRLAVRLLYLDCLKKLSSYQLIDWQPAKTNTAYVNELSDADLHTGFKQLTRQFEYVWYGDFGIDQQRFMQVHEAFQQFDKQLK
ncbi:DUF4129 domain-containing protein [Parapedobacter tibetensis]|uniref:DUF4129 domain-containing protein n=1 Tax=Parapedobacter tibetensis TaxID=2972951 RepID=UPI00214DBABD|nr:DUF4129 domain-containing protein [Parapedobacter tibetensis]